MSAPEGWTCTIQEPAKSRDQEARYHAMIADIAKQALFMETILPPDDWKRILIDAFARIKAAEGAPLKGWGKVVPSLDGTGFVQLGVQSRNFRKSEAAEFTEYLYAFGVENSVKWSEAEQWMIEQYEERR